ncbi:Transcriptional regulator, GntR family domain / Aspartate aminotransferase [[Actinomadura] parvosata subsp. kistnae]|uniref:GntR family transcriptional regulator n=1 Tax=[Actinomadura] parvosata subsp. kistnae TaxID=1909395 RepID=A0A1V0AEZ7_9ACTN|nr:PLP-dependent aminotransferase family protein [Nonomuraea sp. ATCC 55076]AQZ68766.1 GntR family transcriptional regulator [Nonomuraea sp. ATCC 55076]SPL92727.1 Transcriptional regulator, GntR family domain / Aspartate aminotransferase [Actinomadura parvosata subsp. kistnae]
MADLHIQIDRGKGGIAGQIASELRASIRGGRLTPGTRLPATRDLAADLQVSRGVVVEAYEQLVAEGFLVSRVGVGTQVAPKSPVPKPPPEPARLQAPPAPRRAPMGQICYSYYGHRPTSPDLGHFPRERWLAAVRHVLTTVPSDAFDYGDPGGVPELREELAAYLRRVRAADVRPENLIIVGGVAQGLSLALHVLTQQGALRLAVEDPTSHRQVPLLRRAGAHLVPVPVDEQGLDVRALSGDAVLVTPAHQFPTGVVLSPPRRAALMEWAYAGHRVVLEDDYDAEFRFDRDPVGCLQGLAPDRVILSGSVSKALAPGLRLGWVAAPPDLAEAIRRARGELDLGSPVIEQYALAHFLRTGGYDKHLRRMRREYRRRRDALVAALAQELPRITVRGIEAGLHVYLELPPGWDEERTAEAARQLGMSAEPVGPMRHRPGREAVVVGFARLPAHRAAEVVRAWKVSMSGQAVD